MEDIINLTPTLSKQIKITIDKYATDKVKKKGYSEIIGWYAKGFLTKGQANKVQSFYNTFNPSDPKDREQKQIYDEVNILPFCKTNLHQIAYRDEMKAKQRSRASVTQTRNVDRMNSHTRASIRPPQIDPTPTAINENQIQAETNRIIDIINKTKGVV